MFKPIKVVDIELSQPLATIENLGDYQSLRALVRLHGDPVGFVDVPVRGDHCPAQVISQAILEEHQEAITRLALANKLARPSSSGDLCLDDLLDVPPPVCEGPWPLVTVAVCTRDRTAALAQCLDALLQLDYPNLDILVVDNAPSSEATRQLVRIQYPPVRYVREPVPGLNWARNRAVAEARGEIIAFADDDVIVDRGWVTAVVQPFLADDDVMAVTGLVVPYELETEAQFMFEAYGGFSRGFRRRWHRVDPDNGSKWEYRGAGAFGTGANMAFRRSLFDQIGLFDPALDVGTVTNGGGDLGMFFRVLKEGFMLVYEPRAIVRHWHRREYGHLLTQITNNGVGLYSYFMRSAWFYPEERRGFWRIGVWWLWWGILRRLLLSFLRPDRLPRQLFLGELKGAFVGLGRYRQARRTAVALAVAHGVDLPADRVARSRSGSGGKDGWATAVRIVDASQPLAAINDVDDYVQARIFVTWQDRPIGAVDILNCRKPISALQLRDAIVNELATPLLAAMGERQIYLPHERPRLALAWRLGLAHKRPSPPVLPPDKSVSIVLATFDRPSDLRQSLACLLAQETRRPVEIIVVDNHPASGLTPPVLAQFPGVTLVNEPRQGLAYARNAGIRASSGDIIVATDDDVTMPPDWLEKLVAPFAENDVMVVTGNVLPAELETQAQNLFEAYGGLGRGFERMKVDGRWFESFRSSGVPTWTLGATANAAFRADIFHDPAIGLMDEALGPGLPSGVGEDTYLFYRVLKAGYALVYEPGAYVLHRHRQTMRSLRRQLYGYSKGHVAYHLTTLLRDHDLRAIPHVLMRLPFWHAFRLARWLLGRRDYPLRLILMEMWGNLLGPLVLAQSRWRVWRQGRSERVVPPAPRQPGLIPGVAVANSRQLVGLGKTSRLPELVE